MRVAVNGFGRIGRAVFRIAERSDALDVVAVNDLADHDALAYLLTYDTVMGRFEGGVAVEDGELVTPHSRARMVRERDPRRLPWAELEVDAVVESTGVFRARDEVAMHLEAGAKRALLTVPAKGAIDYTVVLGVNEDGLRPEHRIVSNASCTTNCLAPVAKVINDSFGIREGVINTVHAYTNDQSLADVPHADWRRSRAAAENIIPTSTGAAKAVGEVLPELNGRLDGIASRVPVPDGSVVDLFVALERPAGVYAVHAAMQAAADSPRMKNVLAVHPRAGGVFRHHRQPALLHLRRLVHPGHRRPLPEGAVLVRQRVGLFEPGLRPARPDGGGRRLRRLAERYSG